MTKIDIDPYTKNSKEAIFRRLFHLFSFWYLIYYFMDDKVPIIELDKRIFAILIVSSIIIIEIFRIKYRYLFPGMRPYEAYQLGGYAWGALGVLITLLFFPLRFAAPTLLGISFIDPMIGISRNYIKEKNQSLSSFKKYLIYPSLPALCYFLIMFFSISLLSQHSITNSLVLSLSGTAAGLIAENINPEKYRFARVVDDDFRMQIAPLITLASIEFILSF